MTTGAGGGSYHECKRMLNEVINSTIQYRSYRMSVERAVEILEAALADMSWFRGKPIRVQFRDNIVSTMLALHKRALKELWECGGELRSDEFFDYLESKLREATMLDRRL